MSFLRERVAQQTTKILEDQTTSEEVKLIESQRRDALYQEEERKILSSSEHQRMLEIANNEIREILELLYENFSKNGNFKMSISSMGRLGGIKVVAQDGTPVFDNPFGFVEAKMELGDANSTIYTVQLSYRETGMLVSLSSQYWGSDVLGESSWQSGHGCYGTLEEVQSSVVEIVAKRQAHQQRKRN